MIAYRKWHTWRGEGSAEAWLHRIAIRVAISHQRHARLGSVASLLHRLGHPRDVAPVDAAVVESDALLTALHRLPAKQAAAIVLRHHHGYTSREIAQALGVPESTVASRLAMGRKALASALGRDPEAPGRDPPGTTRSNRGESR